MAINCLVPWGTEAIPRVRCSRQNGSEQKERWGQFGPTLFGVGVHPPRRGVPNRWSHQMFTTLHTRVAEHAGRSFRTASLLTVPPHSNIKQHALSCGVPVSIDHTAMFLLNALLSAHLGLDSSSHADCWSFLWLHRNITWCKFSQRSSGKVPWRN